jgi:enterochelin esterase family protein
MLGPWRIAGWGAALLVAASLLPRPAPAGAAPSTVSEHLLFASPALGRDMAYSLYLPPGYSAKGGPYPVIYLLHGVGDDDAVWPEEGKVRETADRLIAEKVLPPAIIVMPDAKTSWYVDSADVGGPGNYDTAIDRDLVAMIDATMPTIAERRGRAVAGISMGGFGALRFGLRRPFRYASVVAMSPALWLRVKPGVEIEEARTERVFRGSFGKPFNVDRFLKLTPVNEVAALQGEAKPPRIMLLVGDKETFSPPDARAFYDMLVDAGAKPEFDTGAGNHNWAFWSTALEPVLRFIGRGFPGQS